ncbi:MAG: twin-arginine translocase TatA/TatE family subunit [Bacteroidaceae bacterium]|nr:twin-arginine translocase TatA/TatE family subunit [Bacteroidaceae bacterium]
MMNLLFIGGIGFQEILLVLLIILLLYGGKKVPEMMRGLGKGVKAFKDGMNEVEPKEEPKEKADETKEEK